MTVLATLPVVLPDRMQFPEYIKRELSEVYLLMDHIAGRQDQSLDAALAAPTTGGVTITLDALCALAWPPNDQDRAKTLSLVLTAKDRLSRSVFPATGHSIAFTLLSTVPSTELRQKRQRPWRPMARPKGGNPQLAGSRDPADEAALAEAVRSSTILQFARDAFPGLDGKCGLLQTTTHWLVGVLVAMLFVTCAASWDLAIGQRLLSDYRWLAEHPSVLLIDPEDKNDIFCPKTASGGDSVAPKVPDLTKDGGLCARYLATVRVRPMMERWNAWQFMLRGLESNGVPRGPGVLDTAQTLEETRLLVTTINYNVLPLVLGALAAAAAALRSIFTKIAASELDPRDLAQLWPRVVLGAFLGAVIGLLDSPGASNGLFTLVSASAGPGGTVATGDTVALSPAAYAFLAGFATGRIFQWLDDVVDRVFSFASPNTKPCAKR